MEYTTIGKINEYVSKSVSPSNTPNTTFEVYSVPSFDTGHPEYLLGSEIASNKQIVRKGDVLLCKINPRINRVWIVADETEYQSIASSEWIVIRSKEYDPEFLAWYFRSPIFKKLMVSEVTGIGGSLTRAQPKRVAEYPVPKVDKDVQKQIVATLNCVDKVISSDKQRLVKLDELVKVRFVEIFGDIESNPYGWMQTTIGNCCTIRSGTSLSAEKENEGGIIPYVKVGDMSYPGNEHYITTSSRFVSEKTAGSGVFPIGTVIFPKRGGAIGTNKKRLTTIPICADLNVMGVTAEEQITPQYLMAYFCLIDLGALDNGSSVPQINNKDIAPLVISIPPLPLQNQFADFVSLVDKSKAAVQSALDKAQLLFDSLMQKYFG